MLHQLKIVLRNVTPAVVREVLVPSDVRLDQLHEVIQVCMGWSDSHLHQFIVGGNPRNGVRYGPPGMELDFTENERKASLQLVAPARSSRFLYVYDFGDDWIHDITVVAVETTADSVDKLKCLTGEGACPPEDCGGPWRYADMLKILDDPEHEDYEDTLEWIGEDWDASAFDSTAVNRELTALNEFWNKMASKAKPAKARSRGASRPKS